MRPARAHEIMTRRVAESDFRSDHGGSVSRNLSSFQLHSYLFHRSDQRTKTLVWLASPLLAFIAYRGLLRLLTPSALPGIPHNGSLRPLGGLPTIVSWVKERLCGPLRAAEADASAQEPGRLMSYIDEMYLKRAYSCFRCRS